MHYLLGLIACLGLPLLALWLLLQLLIAMSVG